MIKTNKLEVNHQLEKRSIPLSGFFAINYSYHGNGLEIEKYSQRLKKWIGLEDVPAMDCYRFGVQLIEKRLIIIGGYTYVNGKVRSLQTVRIFSFDVQLLFISNS